MLPLRWKIAAQSRGLLRAPSTLQLRASLAPASQTSRQRAALRGRVERPLSRVFNQQRTIVSHASSSSEISARPRPLGVLSRQNVSATTVLRSAFPTKTAIFLLLVGGLAYFLLDAIGEEDWEDVLDATSEEVPSRSWPVHFNANRDELGHSLHHILTAHSETQNILKNPDVAREISARFSSLVAGWMMTEQDAKYNNVPITHGCRHMSNTPYEDRLALGTNPGPGEKPWNYWSIMDGHAGPQTAQFLQHCLVPLVSYALSSLPLTSGPMEIENKFKKAFLEADRHIMESARTAVGWNAAASAPALGALAPALSGSCALLAAFDPEKSTLHVACTGDSRAVLGRWDESCNSYKCIPLSEDQTGFNPKEVARLAEAHPDEPDIIDPKTGRLLGMAVTRAFGDHRWKWDNDFVKSVQERFWATAPRPGNKTPPYMTAEPEVTETDIVRVNPRDKTHRGKSDFMILASDGLWDRISSEHAVECVNRWLDAKARGKGSVTQDPQLLANPPDFSPATTLEPGVEIVNGAVEWQATPEYFAIEDENAAVCLVRNALGGNRRSLFLGVLNLAPPWARGAVDDTTVMVVFFDELKRKGVKGEQGSKKRWWMPTQFLGLGNKVA
ncbi:protein serine/threonine phosphatase 2C [Plenodomus tracheiphilus IPT5]|uniref:Protein serine/threonine phosphatase 2C n=1 Tax=Plenodomus tracheiphilus IPT5 TaxID=1408161 RepID=A0A6A7BFK7_9PLEO|nr:protein serine/threonine phosphatase 2C [Plenodomus tracheiphilus IPT5]